LSLTELPSLRKRYESSLLSAAATIVPDDMSTTSDVPWEYEVVAAFMIEAAKKISGRKSLFSSPLFITNSSVMADEFWSQQ
jgi:hypothetical protein